MSFADASSGASDDTAVTGAIFLRGLSPKEKVMWPKKKKGLDVAMHAMFNW